jgi:hypothetical protein
MDIQISESNRALVSTALMRFHDRTDAVSNRLSQLQRAHAVWQHECLPASADTSLPVLVLGLTEEVCKELSEAVDKFAAAVHGAGDLGAALEHEIFDGLGDALIYVTAICTSIGLDFGTICSDFDADKVESYSGREMLDLIQAVGSLAHIVGKRCQKTRGYVDDRQFFEHAGVTLASICNYIHQLCFQHDWVPEVLYSDVLGEVMKRDWRA